MAGPARWYDDYGMILSELHKRGLYLQANQLQQQVLMSTSIAQASQAIEKHRQLLEMWRDDAWLEESGRVAMELHARGHEHEAREMMELISRAFSQEDAEAIYGRYVKILTGEQAGERRWIPARVVA